jgi:PAS domain S-box-containing protein
MMASLSIPGVEVGPMLVGPTTFIVTCSGIIYSVFRNRNIIEADRQRDLQEKEERYRTLLETSYEGICVLSGDKILDANPNFARLFGYQLPELVGESVLKLMPEEDKSGMLASMQTMIGHLAKVPVYKKDGTPFFIETISKMQIYHGQPTQVIAIRDITERVQAEEALDQNERLYRTLFEGANDAIFLLSLSNIHIAANEKAAEMLGYPVQELVGLRTSDVIVPREYPESQQVKTALLQGEVVPLYESTFRKKNGVEFPVEINVSLVHDPDGNPLCIQSVVRDITERKRTERRMQNQLEQLKALREIDSLITSSLDLNVTLNVLLNHVSAQMGSDAAELLLLNPNLYHLEYCADRGFLPGEIMRGPIRLDDPLAGLAAFDRRLVSIYDLSSVAEDNPRLASLASHGYLVGFAMPLIAKGLVKGVLEVFFRKPFAPLPEWTDFLETLGGQAAIAVDSAELFRNLQRSNIDLIRSYDATLEGWAKALELRDEDTEGHSQRVSDTTVQIGRALGIEDVQLIHLHRGAMLHDIGKMGIPDSILLKPGPLTEEEWVVMKQHPVYAKEMLSPIPFLNPALDIPYSHHERWDGSGYPLGLKGESIPLAARIFAVVDVWDALTSDRPYRKRWSREKTLEYILSHTGILFDPIVVTALQNHLDQGG